MLGLSQSYIRGHAECEALSCRDLLKHFRRGVDQIFKMLRIIFSFFCIKIVKFWKPRKSRLEIPTEPGNPSTRRITFRVGVNLTNLSWKRGRTWNKREIRVFQKVEVQWFGVKEVSPPSKNVFFELYDDYLLAFFTFYRKFDQIHPNSKSNSSRWGFSRLRCNF